MAIKDNVRAGVTARDTAGGRELVKTIDVDGLTGDEDGRMIQALDHEQVPRLNERHSIDSSIQVISREAAPNGAAGARVTVVYGVPGTDQEAASDDGIGQIELSTTAITESTKRDRNGNLMIVHYEGRPGFIGSDGKFDTVSGWAVSAFVTASTVIEAADETTLVQVSIPRIESRPPFERAARFTHTVNATPVWGFPAETWRCIGVRSNPVNNGVTHKVMYDFVYKASTWRLEGRLTAFPLFPIDGTDGNGIEYFDVMPTAEFNDLGLDLDIQP